MPHYRSGCGGIDLFLGGFSYINAQAFTQLLRNIGSNAGGYAFNLALATVTPQIKSVLDELSAKVQQMTNQSIRFLWVVVATNLLFLPKTTIFIHDPLCNTKSKVDNVPFALGAFASIVSQVGKSITEKFESVFSLPDYMPYHKTGTVFASALMSQVGQFRIVDPVFKGNMERFVNQCIVYDAMIGHKYTLNDLDEFDQNFLEG